VSRSRSDRPDTRSYRSTRLATAPLLFDHLVGDSRESAHARGVLGRSTSVQVMDVFDGIAMPLAERMWAVQRADTDGPRLIFPFSRTDVARVSEQESRVLLCQLLEQSGLYYSVETPTREKYTQSGSYDLSGRVDVTVYSSRSATDRLLNVELKAGTPPMEAFRKDFEKLTREGIEGLWFHTLAAAGSRTVENLTAKMAEALGLLATHTSAARHTIVVAVCLLEAEVLLRRRIVLGADVESQLIDGPDAATGWTATGPGAARFLDTLGDVLGAPTSARDRRGREKLLILCPAVADDTLLHFSRQGDSYRLRAFAGALAGRAPWVQDDAPTSSDFLRQFPPVHTVDVLDQSVPLTEADRWHAIVTEHNRALGIGI